MPFSSSLNALLDLWGLPLGRASLEAWSAQLLSVGAGVLGALVVFLVGRALITFTLRRAFRPFILREADSRPHTANRLITLQGVARSCLLYTLWFIVLVMVLNALGLNPSSLLATAGVAGVAIGFGAQKLVKDVVTGFLLLLEDQFAVGDVVSIGGNLGVVEETGMRTTRLRDDTGRLIILSNGDIGQVINYSRGPYRVVVDAAVTADTTMDAMTRVAEATGKRLAQDGSPLTNVALRGVTGMNAASVTYRIDAEVPSEHRLVAEPQLREALRQTLRDLGVPLT